MSLIELLLNSFASTAMVAGLLWLLRNWISVRLNKSVEHEFNKKIESVRSEMRQSEEMLKAKLRDRESEITALRSGALNSQVSRQIALDKRSLEAVEQIWHGFNQLGKGRTASTLMSAIHFERAAEQAEKNPKVREGFKAIADGSPKLTDIDLSESSKARPFVTPMVWAIFKAYTSAATHGLIQLQLLSTGLGSDLIKKGEVAKLIKEVLPEQSTYMDKVGDDGLHYMLPLLEEKLLNEIQVMLMGEGKDEASIKAAAKVLSLARSANQQMSEPINPKEFPAAADLLLTTPEPA